MDWNGTTEGLLTAIGLGLLVGVVRERHHVDGQHAAGVRTYTLAAMAAAIATGFGPAVLVAALAVGGALVLAAYWRLSAQDPGLTGEFALVATMLLAALAQASPVLAAALGVITAALLHAKQPLQRFAREVVSEREIRDVLLLAGAALVVLPLLPDHPVDPWQVLVPSRLWRLVVLVMAVGMLGHVALRVAGARWGLVVAGFFAGFASSTAAVASFGQRASAVPAQRGASIAAALLANLASLLLLAALVAAIDADSVRNTWPVLAAAGVVLVLASCPGLLHARTAVDSVPSEPTPRAFRLTHALLLGALIATLLVVSGWLREVFGEAGAIAAAALVALVELHAAAAGVIQLASGGGLTPLQERWGLVALLAASGAAKSVLAFAAGGRRNGLGVGGGLAAMVVASALAALVAT